MIQLFDQKSLSTAVITAIVWYISNYYIRLGLNPAVTDLESRRIDLLYGALSVFASCLILAIIQSQITPLT